MTLGLDLSSAEAKVARAKAHLKTLDRKMTAFIKEGGAYQFRFDLDIKTGWCSVVMVPGEIAKQGFGVIFGDIMHNLRSALDYIVTALVDASGAKLTTGHQFPIYRAKTTYMNNVGPWSNPKAGGPLAGIKVGTRVVQDLQPYHRQPQPRSDPLWHVHRFSNADKHREVSTMVPVPMPGSIEIKYNGIVVESVVIDEIPDWLPTKEFEIHRMRFDPPYATDLRVEGQMNVGVGFMTGAFAAEPWHGVTFKAVGETCNHVGMVVNTFKLL